MTEEHIEEQTGKEPHELDDAALEAALKAETQDTIEDTEESQDEEKATEEKLTETAAKEEKAETEEKAEEEPQPTEVDTLKAELERLKKQVEDKELFIQQRGTEIGELRRKLEQRELMLRQKVSEEGFGFDEARELNEISQERARIDSDEKTQLRKMNEQFIRGAVPDFDDAMVGDIAEVARGQGVPEEVIGAFKRDPFAENPSTLMGFVNQVRMKRRYDNLEKELTKLREQYNPEIVAKKIEEAAKRKPTLTAKDQGTPDTSSFVDTLTEADISRLSDEQLAEAMKKLTGG